MDAYDVGQRVTFKCEFRRMVGGILTLADPTSVSVTFKPDNGDDVTVTPTRLSTGVYEVARTLDSPGFWYVDWLATGNVEASPVDVVYARPDA